MTNEIKVTKYSEATQAILNKIESMNVKTCDDTHTDNTPIVFEGYVILKREDGTEYVCPLFANKYFCLNYMYLNKKGDTLILSQMSVGGNIDARNQSLTLAVAEYVENQSPWIAQLVDHKVWDRSDNNLHISAVKYSEETLAIIDVINRMDKKMDKQFYFDSHTHDEVLKMNRRLFDGYIVLRRKSDNVEFVCPLLSGTIFCLNRLYLKKVDYKGTEKTALVLSQMSVGGNIDARHSYLEDAVKAYISEQTEFSTPVVGYEIWNQ